MELAANSASNFSPIGNRQSVIRPLIYLFNVDDMASYHLLFACRHLAYRPLLT